MTQSFLQSAWILIISLHLVKDRTLISQLPLPISHNSNYNLTSFLAINHWQQVAMCKAALEVKSHRPFFFREMLFNSLRSRWYDCIDFTHTCQSTETIFALYAWWHIRRIDGIKSWNCRQGIGAESWPAESQYISQTSNIVSLLKLCLLLALFINEIHAKKGNWKYPEKIWSICTMECWVYVVPLKNLSDLSHL